MMDNSKLEQIEKVEQSHSRPIYRFQFTAECMQLLLEFSKIHQYDERKEFQEAFQEWTEENSELVESETMRLLELGFSGDVIDKMYKSARYYFKKKPLVKKEKTLRCQYIGIDRTLLTCIDMHIREHYREKPQDAFEDFCKVYSMQIDTSIKNLLEKNFNKEEAMDKIKKTYKNKYSKWQ